MQQQVGRQTRQLGRLLWQPLVILPEDSAMPDFGSVTNLIFVRNSLMRDFDVIQLTDAVGVSRVWREPFWSPRIAEEGGMDQKDKLIFEPLVAIITRTKNRNLLLKRAIESVLAQHETRWLHVIVNDGGDRKAVEECVEAYAVRYDDRVKLIHHSLSVGMEAASNVGIRASESKYICVLDDDDTWDPLFLHKMIAALESEKWPHTRAVFCHTQIVFEKVVDELIIEQRREDFNQWITGINLLDLSAWNRIVPVGLLYERDALVEVGLYDEALPVCGDWEFNMRFLWKYEIACLRENLAFWHQRPDAAGEYSNSIFGGNVQHELYRARLINRWLRDAFAQKEALAFGFTFGLVSELHHKIYDMQQELRELKDGLNQKTVRRGIFGLSSK